jgi:hypothetical protein
MTPAVGQPKSILTSVSSAAIRWAFVKRGIGRRMLLGKRAESIILGGKIDVFWGIAINILFPPSRLPRSSAIERQTGGRHEWPEGRPQAVVSEFAFIREIRTQKTDASNAQGSPVSDSNLTG